MIKINLLPKAQKEIVIFNINFFIGITIFILASVSMGWVYYYQKKQISFIKEKNYILNLDIQNYKKSLKQIDLIKKDKEDLILQLNDFKKNSDNNGKLVLILDEIYKLLPQDIWLVLFRNFGENIILKGNALSRESIDEFIIKLKQSSFFTEINLCNTDQSTIDNKKVSTFEIDGKFKIKQ